MTAPGDLLQGWSVAVGEGDAVQVAVGEGEGLAVGVIVGSKVGVAGSGVSDGAGKDGPSAASSGAVGPDGPQAARRSPASRPASRFIGIAVSILLLAAVF